MNYYEFGTGAALGAGMIISIIYLHLRLKKVESQLLQSRQQNVDNEIVQKNHLLSNDERAALLGERLGRNSKT